MEYELLDTDELRQRANERIAQIIITVEETVLANLKKEQVNFV